MKTPCLEDRTLGTTLNPSLTLRLAVCVWVLPPWRRQRTGNSEGVGGGGGGEVGVLGWGGG